MTNASNTIAEYIDLLETKTQLLGDLADIHRETIKKQAASIRNYKDANVSLQASQDKLLERVEELDSTVTHWQDLWEREHAAFEQAAAERDQALHDKSGQFNEMCSRYDAMANDYADLASTFELKQREYDVLVSELEKALTKLAVLEGKQDTSTEDSKGWSAAYDDLSGRYAMAQCFIDNICEMAACDCDLSDIAEECMQWRRGDWEYSFSEVGDASEPVVEAEDEDDTVRQCCGGPSDTYRWKVMVVDNYREEPYFTGFYATYDLARESADLMVARGCYGAWVEEVI